MLKVVCVYRTGGDYGREDVKRMKSMVAKHLTVPYEFCCLSNDEEIADMPLCTDYDRWWCKVELFRIKGPVLYFDLDVTILKNIDELALAVLALKDKFLMMPPCSEAVVAEESFSSSIMGWNGDYEWLFDHFDVNHMYYRGDQTYITHHLVEKSVDITMVSDVVNVVGWNSNGQYGIPKDTQIINFFGNPRPKQLGVPYYAPFN